MRCTAGKCRRHHISWEMLRAAITACAGISVDLEGCEFRKLEKYSLEEAVAGMELRLGIQYREGTGDASVGEQMDRTEEMEYNNQIKQGRVNGNEERREGEKK